MFVPAAAASVGSVGALVSDGVSVDAIVVLLKGRQSAAMLLLALMPCQQHFAAPTLAIRSALAKLLYRARGAVVRYMYRLL